MPASSLPALAHRRKSGACTLGTRLPWTDACYPRAAVVKQLLLSILIATFVLSIAAARVRQPRRALLSLLWLMVAVEVCYAIFLAVLYRRYA
jgi:hypothetical protein